MTKKRNGFAFSKRLNEFLNSCFPHKIISPAPYSPDSKVSLLMRIFQTVATGFGKQLQDRVQTQNVKIPRVYHEKSNIRETTCFLPKTLP
jgi:hypothetical protein